ncbi:MAG: ACT domain-containing protein [Lachnospiraceae bacterium]|nr:ACT domain-containing protein [Lachnospiraceae bacterium]
MTENNNYFIVKKKALPEVLLKVVEAKRLLEADKNMTVQAAMNEVGISRSSYYKYKDDIMPFRENLQGKTITFMIIMEDIPGLLSAVLAVIAEYDANILTILQAIPVNGVASLTISVDVLSSSTDISDMLSNLEQLKGICELKLLSRE